MLFTACASVSGSRDARPSEPSAVPVDEAAVLPAPAPASPLVKAGIYEALAGMSRAEAEGDTLATEAALESAMNGIRTLARSPDLLQDAELRELYRSVVTAYEQYYGVADTLSLAYGDVFAFREAMFASMNEVKQPLLEDVTVPDVEPVAAVIPMDQNRLVEQSIQYLLKTPEKHVYRWLSRAETYFPMIEQVLREEGVPDELKYLAMIESGLNPRAVSRAGAGGMWQFMPATGRAYGLSITHWVDERLDPEKATRAAARHLRDLHRQFGGDWHLALAGYNTSPGRVTRAMRQYKARTGRTATFWDVYQSLPRETRNYVPMFIAAATVAARPTAFSLQPAQPGPQYAYDVGAVEGMLDLKTVAELAGTSVDEVRALNPELRQWATPPSRTAYRLRLPRGSYQRFSDAYAALPPERRQGQQATHAVRRGDTLGKIARRYGTTVDALQEMNGLRGSLIQVGQTLYVPVRYENLTGAAVASGTQAVAYEPSNIRLASAPAEERAAPAPAPPPRERAAATTYRVRRGDTLLEIARHHGVTVAELKQWNGLQSSRIQAGQRLSLRGTAAAAEEKGGERVIHKVRRGDALSTIARRYGVTVAALKRWNELQSSRIQSGQRLVVYVASARAAGSGPAGRAAWVPYHVRRGDTLTDIAQRYGVTVAALKKWNALQSGYIYVGQRLAVYTRIRL